MLQDRARAWFSENEGRLHWKEDPRLPTRGAFRLDEGASDRERPAVFLDLPNPEQTDHPHRMFRLTWGKKIVVEDLELGDSLEDAIVELAWSEHPPATWKVAMQFETSAAVGDEGPHLDLVKWKHFTSTWRELDSLGPLRFHVPVLTEEEQTLFPTYTQQELDVAVRAAGGEEWLERMKQGAEAYVAVWVMRLRVIDEAFPDKPFTIEFLIPMGC